ncbi:MAG: aldehyde ferredoxin oxidoreductase C-terminal domain-containing protein [Desulfobacterales bacterium]|nr:aldehyde ferredoxin oxidoreductase C-terminal domain-containing protein [Desulfobacterales bacterium]
MEHREDFGDVLADGWKGAIARIGKGVEAYAPIIKGIESAHYDFRQNFCADAFNGLGEPRGPNCPSGESPTVLPLKTSDKVWRNCDEIGVPFDVKEKIFDHPDVIDITDNTDWTTREIVEASLDRWQVEDQSRLSNNQERDTI